MKCRTCGTTLVSVYGGSSVYCPKCYPINKPPEWRPSNHSECFRCREKDKEIAELKRKLAEKSPTWEGVA